MDLANLTNEDGLIVRQVAIRAADTDAGEAMEFTGIGVPYGEIYDTGWGYRETFDPGSVDASNAKIYDRHREVIGVAKTGKDVAAGFEVTGKISKTTRGLDAWELLKDGAYDSLSIGFKPLAWREDEDGVVHITEAIANEFSLVHNPAYKDAKITSHRDSSNPKEGTMPTDADTLTRADLQPILDGQAEFERQLQRIGNPTPAGPAVPEFRSIGEFIRAIAEGDEAAAEFHRAMATGTISDAIVKDSWVGNYIKLVAERRRVYNTFGTGTLPATGMSVEFGKLEADTTVVAEQVEEGDALAGPGGIKLAIDNATVHTDGGWSELSFQAIQRATVPVLDTLWEAMMMKYAKATEARVRAAYYAIMNGQLAEDPVTNPDAALEIAAGADAKAWLDMILDAALIFEERGHVLHGMHASVDQFKVLNGLTDGDGRRLMNVFGTGVNQVGELNLSTVSGSLANVRVELIGNRATTGKLSFYDPVAIKTLESPGAPVRLQDESIINLTKQFSLYGYTAVTTPFPDAILPVKIGA